MKYTLAYGKTGHTFELPGHMNVDIIEPRWVPGLPDQHQAIINAIKNPINSPPLTKLVSPNTKVGIIFSDVTRATPYHIIIPAILSELNNIPRENITFFCANGTHRFAPGEELEKILGKDIVSNYNIVQNDSNRIETHDYVGTTKSGNEIFLNKDVLKCDIKILTGFIEPHFFAGFSGGGKALMPGMAYVNTIKFNHSISNLSKNNVSWGQTYGNPLWEEIMEAAEFVPGLFLMNITLNKNKEITNVFAGDLREAHMAGCEFVKDSAMAAVDKLYDIVITSNSGYPLDLNVYQTVKGMSAAAQIVKQGGNIIIASECWDGIPSNSDYERILTSVENVDGLIGFIKENESSLKDTWQIFCQAGIQQKANVYLYSDKIETATIRKTLLNPVNNISKLTNDLVREIGPQASICIMPEGPQTIPYVRS